MKKTMILLLAFLLCLSLAACVPEIDDSSMRRETETMLDGLIADDPETCRSVLIPEITDDAFATAYAQMREVLGDVTEYTLTPANFHTTVSDGVTKVSIRYRMEAGEQVFFVEVGKLSTQEKLAAFWITPQVTAAVTGSIGNMQGADAVQWVFLAIALLEAIFVIWMLVDACRHKFPQKGLWIALILLGSLVLYVVVGNGNFSFRFNFGIFLNYTSLLRYSTGETVANIYIPLGALIYLLRRKKLLAPPQEPVPVILEDADPIRTESFVQEPETLEIKEE